VASYAVWSDPAGDATNADWHRLVTGSLASFATGYYVGESDVVGDPEHARRSFAPDARAQRSRCGGCTIRPGRSTRSPMNDGGPRGAPYPCRLKYWTARSCFSAA